jgi:hypothetical protein
LDGHVTGIAGAFGAAGNQRGVGHGQRTGGHRDITAGAAAEGRCGHGAAPGQRDLYFNTGNKSFLNSLILRLKYFINISRHIGFVLIKEIIAVNDSF